MKDIIRISAIGLTIAALMGAAMLLPAKSKQLPGVLTPEEVSWAEFCKARGYDVTESSEEVINEFLDTWQGSATEEEILLAYGIEP